MVTVIIPAYNEREHITAVLKKIPDEYNVIVVDDGSTDRTGEISKSLGYKTVILKENMGKSFACNRGLKESNDEINVFIDGDGQLDPKDIPRIISRMENNDLVIGVRNMENIPWHRKFTNSMAKLAIKKITGQSFRDVLCGLRSIKKSSYERLGVNSRDYFFEVDMIIKASILNMKIEEVPISVSYESGSRMAKRSSLSLAKHLALGALKLKLTGRSHF